MGGSNTLSVLIGLSVYPIMRHTIFSKRHRHRLEDPGSGPCRSEDPMSHYPSPYRTKHELNQRDTMHVSSFPSLLRVGRREKLVNLVTDL